MEPRIFPRPCSIAAALTILGEKWSLLVDREEHRRAAGHPDEPPAPPRGRRRPRETPVPGAARPFRVPPHRGRQRAPPRAVEPRAVGRPVGVRRAPDGVRSQLRRGRRAGAHLPRLRRRDHRARSAGPLAAGRVEHRRVRRGRRLERAEKPGPDAGCEARRDRRRTVRHREVERSGARVVARVLGGHRLHGLDEREERPAALPGPRTTARAGRTRLL